MEVHYTISLKLATETVGPSGLPRLTFEVTSNQKVQIPLYYLKILTFERMLRNL